MAGVKETATSFREGETGEGVGHLISTVGYGCEFVGALAGAMAVPGLGAFVVVGAALVMIGNSIVKIFKKTDLQHLVRHCCWGTDYGDTGPEREWAVVPFEQWKGRYDLQLKSLIQLLCQFEIEDDRWSGLQRIHIPSNLDTIRTVKVQLGWLPIGVRIEATYIEQWEGTGTQKLRGSWEVTNQDSVTGDFVIEAKAGSTLKIEIKKEELEISPLGTSPRSDLVHMFHGAKSNYNRWHNDFRDLKVWIRLALPTGNEEVSIPYKGLFKEATIVHNDNSWSEE
jgi:hypothetical protein